MPRRRDFIGTVTSAMFLSGFCRLSDAAGQESDEAAPHADLIEAPRTFSRPADRYYGWPTVTRTSDGRLLVVASGGRQQHVCPFGRVDLLSSYDNGETWSWARTICDGPIDDRDAGILQTNTGTLLVTTFTSLAYLPNLNKAAAAAADGNPIWDAERLSAWQAAHARLPAETHSQHLGNWMLRSVDNGITWSAPYRVPLNSPHGPIQLSNGDQLYAGKALWEAPTRMGVCRSRDDGLSWDWLADIPARPGDSVRDYHELHCVETDSGRLVTHIRNHNAANNREVLQSVSEDGGITWSVPHAIGVWGLPSHLLKLANGQLLMTYGHRRAPLGIQARLSTDEGDSWSDPLLLYTGGTSTDLGYPSTVQFPDQSLLTVWYEALPGERGAQLRTGRWVLPE
jgi:sialidase-1